MPMILSANRNGTMPWMLPNRWRESQMSESRHRRMVSPLLSNAPYTVSVITRRRPLHTSIAFGGAPCFFLFAFLPRVVPHFLQNPCQLRSGNRPNTVPHFLPILPHLWYRPHPQRD